MNFEAVIGLEIHSQLLTEHENLLRLRHDVRRAAEYRRLSGLSGPAGRAAGAEPAGGRAGDSCRARAQLHHSVAVDLRAQELLLSGPAEGLPDLPVRSAARDRRVGAGLGRAARAHHARPHGRGRRQVAAPRLSRFGSRDLSRLQSVRRAADRDRHRAGSAIGRRRGGLLSRICARSSSRSASTTATWKRAACAATPTCRCGRWGSTTFGTKAEVKNVNSFKYLQKALEFEIDAADRARDEWRPRASGDAAVGQRARRDVLDAQQGRGARLSLFPRARSRAGDASMRLDRVDSRVAAGTARGAEGALRRRARPDRVRR